MTIWYDVTTSLRATSRNGIANVEWSIGERVQRLGSEVRFFAYRGRHGLVEIDPDTELATAFYASDAAGAPVDASVTAPTWRDGVRAALREALGPRAVPMIRTMSAVYQSPKRLRARMQGAPSVGRTGPVSKLSDSVRRDDVVVSLGADWEGGLADELSNLRARRGCRVVTMVYDLIPLTHTHLAFHKEPELFERYYTKLLAASDLITCISEQSRQDLLRFARDRGLTAPRTEVLYLGETLPEVPSTIQRDGDFFLWVGTVERRKNLDLLYDALRILESEGVPPPKLVVVGSIGWGVDDLIKELALQSTAASLAIVMLGPVDDATLDHLYRRARALLFPSHYEGWGLPIREAAVRGCPVAAGDSPAVREAVKGFAGATLLPTNDPGPWADFMRVTPPQVEPAHLRPWSEAVAELGRLVASL